MEARRSSPSPLVLGHDVFYGDLQLTRALQGITLSHRLANAPPESVETHTHAEAHFVLVTAGDYLTSARRKPNRRSTLIYNPPGTTHRDRFFDGRGAFFSVSIANDRLADALPFPTEPAAVHLSAERSCGLAAALLMECARWNAASPLKAESLCLELLGETSTAPILAEKLPPSWMRTACELIQDCSSETLGIRRIAHDVGVHPTHLARAFRTFLGCTPGDLLRARRLQLAAVALLESPHSLARIATDSGYSDQAQFTKAFRRLYGVPPGAYRALCMAGRARRAMLRFDKTGRGCAVHNR